MASDLTASGGSVRNLGWRVTFAALGVNLALGILYTWSVISAALPDTWSASQKSMPYAIACLVFCIIMVPAGRLQDKFGPRFVASIGGVLVGLGMILAALIGSPAGYAIGFGVLAGAGIGFGYASATPPAVKWFPASKTGLIAGLVVSGFGLASVYAAPLAKWLSGAYGIQTTMMVLGGAFLVVVVGLAQMLTPPGKGFVAEAAPAAGGKAAPAKQVDYAPKQMLRTPQFYLLWFMYACGAGAGLMIISKLSKIGTDQAGLSLGFLLVAVLAVGNGAGRIIAGVSSDKLGRQVTMCFCFILQAVLVFLLSMATKGSFLATVPMMALISALVGANYGANLSLFPSITKDYYGLKNFGVNYGLVFTAWGVGGFLLALLAGRLYDVYQTFNVAYYGASVLLVLAAFTTFLVKAPKAADAGADAEPETLKEAAS